MSDTSVASVPPVKCPYCGLYHDAICPRVKAIEYNPDGTIKRVELKTIIEGPLGTEPTWS